MRSRVLAALVPLTRMPMPAGADPRRVAGRSCVPIVVLFPAGRLPNVARAIEAALAAGRGTA
jgi:hypothetical protein